MDAKTKAMRMLKAPPCEWEKMLDRNAEGQDWNAVEDYLDAMAQRAAMLAEYIATRKGLDGCGPKDHAECVKRANKRLAAVRKGMGYSHPKSGAFNI